jgi:hypothetical protein
MINGEILKAVKTARAVFHPLSKARKTELRSCFSGAFKLSNLSYLLTWNCKHIANAQIQGKLAEISIDFGYELPILCTPYELLGG